MKRGLLKAIVALASLSFGCGLFAQGKAEQSTGGAVKSLEVTKPVTVRVWHSRGAGPNDVMIKASVKEFNETIGKEKGITVEEAFQGNYAACLAKTQQAIAAGTNPEMVVLDSAVSTPYCAENGMLVDMKPYMVKDGMDIDSFLDTFTAYSRYNGQIVCLPYVRSGLLLYANMDLLKSAGYDHLPATVREMEEMAKAITRKDAAGKTEVWGVSVHNESWIYANWAYQLGSNYASADGKGNPMIKDGTLLKVLTEWKRWTDEGWCAIPSVTDGATHERELFLQGKLGMMLASTGNLAGILKGASFPVEVGLPFSFSDVKSTFAGGGNIAMLSANTDDNARAASWEFIKFLMTPDQVAKNTINTGYLPVRKDSSDNQLLKEFWAKTPQAQTSYNCLKNYGQCVPWCTWYSAFDQVLLRDVSSVILDRTVSPEAAIADMQKEAKILGIN